MSNRPFAYNSANATFSNPNQSVDASDYIIQKKLKYSFCRPNICHPNKNVNTQSNFLNLKKANALAFYPYSNFNKSSLYSNLYSTLQLNYNVLTITNLDGVNPVNVNDTTDAYNYVIDVSGQLFGTNPCGLYNFEDYLVYDNCVLNNSNN
jgi:hypothetical protein